MEDTEEAANDPENAAVAQGIPASFSKTDESGFEGVISSSPVLDLSQRGLCHLGELFKVPTLQQLYLQRNSLSEIPKDFFQLLPNLTWLDLRYNKIRALPSEIGSHRHLKTLLLERNPIKTLPIELGQVTTLKALNLRHCPLEFPPHLIVQKGLVAILTFLRICSVENAFPGEDSTIKMVFSDLPYPVLPRPHRSTSSEKGLNVPSHEAAAVKEKADFFPPMDRLDLSELHKSSASSENWPSEEEIKRFWKLRQEIVENEKVDVLEKKLLAVELPPNLKAALNAKEKRHRKPVPTGRKKSTSFKGILPNLPSVYQNTMRTKRLDDSHMATLRELQEKETLLEQRRRDKRTLQEWREQTQLMRSRREVNKFQPPHRNMMASKIPFATDLIDHGKTPANPLRKMKASRERTVQRSFSPQIATLESQPDVSRDRDVFKNLSASPLADLEEKIRQHTQQICARNFLGTNPLQDMKIANQDLETAKKLEEQLRELKLEMTLNKEHPFATLSENLSLHPPASQPQNIFFNTKY